MKKLLFLAVSLFVVVCLHTTSFAQQAVNDNFTVHGTTLLETGLNDTEGGSVVTNQDGLIGFVQALPSPTRHLYNPPVGYTGTYPINTSFTYKYCWAVQSETVCTDSATVSIEVVNQAPVTVDSTYYIHWFGHLGPWVTGPEGPDYDPDGNELVLSSMEILTSPTKGILFGPGTEADKRLFVPYPGQSGEDFLTYKICDYWGSCSVGRVNIIINDLPPVAVFDFFILTDVARHVNVEANDFSLDNDPFDISADDVGGTTQHGDLLGRATSPEGEDGFTYVRWWQTEPNYIGTDGFHYKIREQQGNGGLLSNEAQVTILIIARDDAEDAGRSCPIVAQPVNVTNGNMWLEQTDYLLPTTASSIEVTRTYNSILQNSGMFGLGWSTLYDESLQFYGDDKMLRLNLPDGKAVYFGRATNSGPFVSVSPDVFAQIVQNQDDTYTLTFKDGRSHKFDSGGTLLWQKDRNGNQTTLTYNTSGFLTLITDSFGRTLELTPNSNGTIAVAEDSTGTVATYEYYTDTNKLKTVSFPDGSKYKFEYTTIGGKTYLTTVKDALDNVLETHAYDSEGRAITSAKQDGVEAYTFDYSVANQTTVTDALGNESIYEFKKNRGKNIITKSTGVCGCGAGGSEMTTYDYDTHLNLIKKTDALSNVTTYKYDNNGNVLEETDVLGTQKYTYNSFGQVLTYTDRMNGVTTNTYDSHGNLLTTTNPLNHTTTLTHTSIGQVHTVTDALNHTTTLTYDSQGRPAQVTDALNKTTELEFDARARLTSVTNALNQETSFQYDLRNRLKKVIYPDTNFISYVYDTAGRVTSMTDERSNTTTYQYDGAYRTTGITDALNHTTSFGYDLMSNMTSQTDALGNVANFEYDDFNRLIKIIHPEAAPSATRLEEEYEYDKVGNITKKTDTAGRETAYHYDNAYRVDYTTDALNQVTNFYYNARSQTTKVKDARNQEYTFTYDPLGRVLSQTRNGATMYFEYDAVGNTEKRTDYNFREAKYYYDNLNRLIHITYGSTEFADYTYDDLSRLATAVNQTGTVTFAYDNRGRMASTTDVHGNTVDYTYDAAGNRTGLELDNSTHTTYQYDNANRLTELSDETNQPSYFAYDNANRLITKTLPNNVVSNYTYDGMSRLTRLKHENPNKETVFFDNTYDYNPASQVSQITDLTQTRDFSYDFVNRLTGVSASSTPTEDYAYDAVGNRTSSQGISSYTHGAFNRTTAAGGTAYTYDNNGNRITKLVPLGEGMPTPRENTGYTWDEENRLIGLHAENTVNSDQTNASYEYDALGRRVRSTVNLAETEFTYDGRDVVKDSGFIYQNGPGIDNKLKSSDGNYSSYFLQDHLGSTVGLSDTETYIYSATDYDSFGNGTNSSFPTRYQFTGREFESETGLQYSRARWYDPQIGRFISEDPIGFGGGINQYAYVSNDPVNKTDPLGLYESDVHYYLTQYLARKNGCFSEQQAQFIAFSTQFVDEKVATTPGPGFTPEQRRVNSENHALTDPSNHQNNLANLWKGTGSGRPSDRLGALGDYNHYQEDTFSHRDYTNSFYGHFFGSYGVDKTNDDVGKSMRMAAMTFETLRRFSREYCGCVGNELTSDDWQQINDFVQAPGGEGGGHYLSHIEKNPALLDNKRNILGLPPRPY